MKQIFQMIALYLTGLDALQIIVTIGSIIITLKMLGTKFSETRHNWKTRQGRRKLESDMWAIE
jgi:hypothetical protein